MSRSDFHRLVLVVACLSCGAIARDVPTTNEPAPDAIPVAAAARPTPEQATAQRGLVAAARETWEVLQLRMEAGEAMTPTFVELIGQASRRLYLAELGTAEDKAARDKALEDHLGRTKALHAVMTKRFEAGLDASRVQVAQANYFLREAELWVAQAKTK